MRVVQPVLVVAATLFASCQIFTAAPPCNAVDDCAPGETCDLTAHACVAAQTDSGTVVVADAGGRPGDAGTAADAGTTPDAGAATEDAGFVSADAGFADAGFVSADAGFGDAGFVLVDGGMVPADGGFPDAGFVAGDGGFPENDAGFADAGADVCGDVATLTLGCGDVAGGTAACTLSVDGESGGLDSASGCVACTTTTGATVLAAASFDGPDGGCDLGGWSLAPATGSLCFDSMASGSCAASGSLKECCDDVDKLCANVAGDRMLRADKGAITGCGFNEELRLRRTFDLTGLVDARVCWTEGQVAVSGANDGVRIFATVGGGAASELSCDVPQLDGTPDGELTPRCVDLPAATDDAPDVEVTFVVHSNDSGDVVYLDDIALTATAAACAADGGSVILASTDFQGCSGTITTVGGWVASGGDIDCRNDFSCGAADDLARVDDTAAQLTQTFDTRGLSDVQLCFFFGDLGADGDDRVTVQLDADGPDAGAGFVDAFTSADVIGQDFQCRQVCVRVSDADPRADDNPALGLRIAVLTSSDQIYLDDLVVRARPRCAAAATPGTISGDAQGYSFAVAGPAQEDVDLVCSVGAVDGFAALRFRAP